MRSAQRPATPVTAGPPNRTRARLWPIATHRLCRLASPPARCLLAAQDNLKTISRGSYILIGHA